MSNIPSPPVPQPLRVMLKDYPELIEDLQQRLNRLIAKMEGRPNATPPFERAIWLLEDSFSSFRSDANKELKVAEQSGNLALIEAAKTKRFVIGRTRNESPWLNGELSGYFKTYRRAFE
jgi:hypothetical protein